MFANAFLKSVLLLDTFIDSAKISSKTKNSLFDVLFNMGKTAPDLPFSLSRKGVIDHYDGQFIRGG